MKSPFKFLDSYTKDDRDIFFGRDHEIEELYQRVFDSKLLLVYGVSGTGKSSLIHCGLANKFQETDWLPLVIRRGGNIIESMTTAIKSASITEQQNKFSSSGDFKKGVRSLYLDHYKPVFFIFDQFEELFIFGDKEERRTFISIVKSLTESDLQCRMIFVMREEYMAGITEFEKYIPTIFSNRVRIEKMSHMNALDAIKGPCKAFNISLEEGFAESLLEKLSPGETDVELTYLQVFLDKIYRLAVGFIPPLQGGQGGSPPTPESQGGSPTPTPAPTLTLNFTLSLLDKTGNVSDLLGSFLDEQISLLDDPETGLALLKSFVSIKGTKRQMSPDEIKDYSQTLGKVIDEEVLQEMLQTFINLRILRDKDQNGRYELRHDALAAKIFEKITMVEKELLEIRQLIENAWHSWQKRGVLLSEEDLQYIAPYESRLYLPDEYEKLIEKSKYELVKVRHRRRNIFSAAAVALIIILSGFTFWAIKERKNAIAERIKATASEQEAITARDNAIESDRKAVASEKEAVAARDRAEVSELKIKKEKEHTEIRERQTRANNFNYLSKEMVNEDPTVALRLAEYALSLDPENKAILINMNSIYYDNLFYKVYLNYKSGNLGQISTDWTRIITTNGRTARLTDLIENKTHLLIGHLVWLLTPDIHQYARKGYDNILCVSFSPNGNLVLTGSSDKTAKLWDTEGNLIQTFKGHLSPVLSVAFSPDGESILTGSSDLTARLWDLKGNTIQKFTGHKNSVNSAVFSPDGKNILTGSGDSTAILWDFKGNILQRFKGHTGPVRKAIFAPDGETILTGSNDQTARLWDLDGNTIQVFSGHTDNITALAFSPDGKTILTGSADKTVRFWDLSGNTLQKFAGAGNVTSFAFHADENKLLTFSSDGILRIWDLSQGVFKTLTGHNSYVYRVAFSADGNTIITLSADATIRLWDINGNSLKTIKYPSNAVAMSPDGKTLLVGLLNPQLIDLNGEILNTYKGQLRGIRSVAFSPDGKTILTGAADKTARLWNLEGKTLQIFTGHSDMVNSVSFSPDGKTILTGSSDNTARLWDLNGNTLQIFRGHNDCVEGAVFSPDGKAILTGSDDKTARLWDLNGYTIQIFSGHTGLITSVAFSPDGKTIITGSTDKTARVWDLNGNTLQILSGNRNNVYSVAYSPDGKAILIGLSDNTAKLFYVKKPLSQFLKESRSEELTTGQKLKYEIISINEVIKEPDIKDLFEGLKFCLSKAKLQDKNKTEYLNNANMLLKKTYGSISEINNRKSFISYALDLYILSPQKYISDKIEEANRLFLQSETKENLKEAYDFYSEKCSLLDSAQITLKLPEYFIQISKKLLAADTAARYTISNDLSGMSWPLIQNRQFRTSLDAMTLAMIADSTNQYAYTTLPLVMLLNNRFDEASKLYQKYYKRYYFGNISSRPFRLIFLEDITELEKKGITHPDFKRARELLNN
jgi:WD40 repeat protein